MSVAVADRRFRIHDEATLELRRAAVIFRFDDQQIEIVAIAHHSRRPTYWKRRG